MVGNRMKQNRASTEWIGCLLILLSITLAVGCVERRLTIHTEPPDAIVWLNDEEIGITPVTVGFNWYGDYKVRIEKDGYQILNTHQDLPRPAEDFFPLDFFAEVLWPGTIRRDTAWTFTLQPTENLSAEQLIKQAAQFKEQAVQELPIVQKEKQQKGNL